MIGPTPAFDSYHFLALRDEPEEAEDRFLEARKLLISEPHTALKYLESAAHENHAASLDLLGMLYATGELLEKNPKRAVDLFKKAATLGQIKAQFHLAMALREGFGCARNPEESFARLRIAAREKLPEAIFALAECYDLGIGTPKNPEYAEQFFSEAAFRGEKRAVLRMIRLASSDTQNPKLCLRWLFKGAQAGIPMCLLAVGRYWIEKQGASIVKGLRFLEQGAFLEDVDCLNELSAFWSDGVFCAPDLVSAIVYSHLAATKSDWIAQNRLIALRARSDQKILMEAAAIASCPSSDTVVRQLVQRGAQRFA